MKLQAKRFFEAFGSVRDSFRKLAISLWLGLRGGIFVARILDSYSFCILQQNKIASDQ